MFHGVKIAGGTAYVIFRDNNIKQDSRKDVKDPPSLYSEINSKRVICGITVAW